MSTSVAPIAPLAREDALVVAARAGDERAFETLHARYRERIEAFIAARLRDPDRAEDIAQEVFVSAHRSLCSSDRPIVFRPWIYEIAGNACVDEHRRRSRSREVPLELDGELATDSQANVPSSPSPPIVLERKQRFADLRAALGGLSDNHRQLIVMRELEGLSYDEIGERTAMSRQMVESALLRARRNLTAEYDAIASGQRCQQVLTAIAEPGVRSIRALGVRERRRLARHLAHCQSCRHEALVAGVDRSLLQPTSIAAKLAGLLPFPLWRWLRRHVARGTRHSGDAGAGSGAAAPAAPPTSPPSLRWLWPALAPVSAWA